MIRPALLWLLLSSPLGAETLIATRNLRPQTLITASDVAMAHGATVGLTHPDQAIGLETRVAIYAGRPIRADDLGPPAAIERNQIVTLIYSTPALHIETEARSLGRAGLGERVRVQNLASRATVTGLVQSNGTVIVKALP